MTAPTLHWPVPYNEARVTSKYGWRVHPILKTAKFHNGMDIGVRGNGAGKNIVSAAAGTVIAVATNKASGKYVKVRHAGGWTTSYSHLSMQLVTKGQKVDAGQLLGFMGSTGLATGPHLHWISKTPSGATRDPANQLRAVDAAKWNVKPTSPSYANPNIKPTVVEVEAAVSTTPMTKVLLALGAGGLLWYITQR